MFSSDDDLNRHLFTLSCADQTLPCELTLKRQ